jgi:hypothetical protein
VELLKIFAPTSLALIGCSCSNGIHEAAKADIDALWASISIQTTSQPPMR